MKIPTTAIDIHKWLAARPNSKRLEVRISPELLKEVREYAEVRGWDMSYAVRFLVARGIAKKH